MIKTLFDFMKGNGDTSIKDIKCKQIRNITQSNKIPKCQEKLNRITNHEINWNLVWTSIHSWSLLTTLNNFSANIYVMISCTLTRDSRKWIHVYLKRRRQLNMQTTLWDTGSSVLQMFLYSKYHQNDLDIMSTNCWRPKKKELFEYNMIIGMFEYSDIVNCTITTYGGQF